MRRSGSFSMAVFSMVAWMIMLPCARPAVAGDGAVAADRRYELTVVARGGGASSLKVYLDAPLTSDGKWPVPQHVPLLALVPLGQEGRSTHVIPLRGVCPGPHSLDAYVTGKLESLTCMLDEKMDGSTRRVCRLEIQGTAKSRHHASASFFNATVEPYSERHATIFYHCRQGKPEISGPKEDLATCFPDKGIETSLLWISPKGDRFYMELRYDHCYRVRILGPRRRRRRGFSLPPSDVPWRRWGKSEVILRDLSRVSATRVSDRMHVSKSPAVTKEAARDLEGLREALSQTFGGAITPVGNRNGGSIGGI